MVAKQHILQSVKSILLDIDENSKVVLFGSRARGDYSIDSDWDILILLEKQATEAIKRHIRDQIFDIELETDEIISTIIENKNDWASYEVTPLFQNIEKEGLVA